MKHQKLVCTFVLATIAHGLLLVVFVVNSKPASEPVVQSQILLTLLIPRMPERQPPADLPAAVKPDKLLSEKTPLTPKDLPPIQRIKNTQVWTISPEEFLASLATPEARAKLQKQHTTSELDTHALVHNFRPQFAEKLKARIADKSVSKMLLARHVAVHGASVDAYNALGKHNGARIKTRYGCGERRSDAPNGASSGVGRGDQWWWVACNEPQKSIWQLPQLETDGLGRAVLP